MREERITLVGLTGLAGTGKDAAARYLCEQYGFVQAAFADPLRSMVHQFLEEAGIDHAWLTERHLKERAIPGLGVSSRALQQAIGTEAVRALDPDLWVRHLHLRLGFGAFPELLEQLPARPSSFWSRVWERVQSLLLGPRSALSFDQAIRGLDFTPTFDAPVHDRIVVSDVRFLNEATWLCSMGGHLVRLHRDSAPPVRAHSSEQSVLLLPADVDLRNDGPTFAGLHGLMDGVMADLGVERREPVDPCYVNPSFG